MIKLISATLLAGFFVYGSAQTIEGQFTLLPQQEIRLEGFNGFGSYIIAKDSTDANGNFKLNYTKDDIGMGFLLSADDKPYIVLLTGEKVVIKGEAPSYVETIVISKGKENQKFVQYATEQPKREQFLSAWRFLDKNYRQDPLLANATKAKADIVSEIVRLNEEESTFLANLPSDSYVKWFLPIRKLVSNVSLVAQYYPEDIPQTREALRAIDYSEPKLYKSGLFREALENHVWFIENSSGDLEVVYKELNHSIDIILNQLLENESLFNEVTDFLFNLLEKRSLFTSAEYLAQRVLNESSCTVTDNVAKQLEAYRKMAVGATVPDIDFGKFTYFPEGVNAIKMSELNSDYFLLVFAAGWCPHCNEELPKIAKLYDEWKQKGVEVILVSLDENGNDFAKFAAPMPFISTTDFKKWDSQAAIDYFVYGTPTYFLVDNQFKLLLRPKNADHAKAWIDYRL
ncbi:MAG: AhpC/TSA family protein [Schleiferiaceae bacterium]|nr:AhpC/TSA family protein [Schleiferiaceae bacterium]